MEASRSERNRRRKLPCFVLLRSVHFSLLDGVDRELEGGPKRNSNWQKSQREREREALYLDGF